jgi:hypothetical protein
MNHAFTCENNLNFSRHNKIDKECFKKIYTNFILMAEAKRLGFIEPLCIDTSFLIFMPSSLCGWLKSNAVSVWSPFAFL